MTSLDNGVYIIQNALYETFAAATSDNENEPIVATSIAGGDADDENTEHWWTITKLRNGTYTLKNWNYGVFAHIDGETIKTSKRIMPFFVYRISGAGHIIRSAFETRCWGLLDGTPGAQVSLVDAPYPAPNKTWKFTRITTFLPRRKRPLEFSLFDKKTKVVIVDHRANCRTTQKLDVVVLLTEVRDLRHMTLRIVRGIYSEVHQICEDNIPAVDIRVGIVIYARDASGWSLSTAWVDDAGKDFVFGEDTSPAPYDFNTAMQKAIEMDWREGAAPAVIFFPQLCPPGALLHTNEVELYQKAKAQHMILVLDAYPEFCGQYLAPESFFYNFATSSPQETVVLPETMMTNWIVASTLYNLEVKDLASKLKPYVSPWSDSDILLKQEILPTSHGAPTTAAHPSASQPGSLMRGIGQQFGPDHGTSGQPYSTQGLADP